MTSFNNVLVTVVYQHDSNMKITCGKGHMQYVGEVTCNMWVLTIVWENRPFRPLIIS